MKEHSAVLVTGGAGFIGSSLVGALLEKGHRVTVLDNFSTGKRENLAGFVSNPDFTLIEGDIRDLETCRKAAEGQDHILHEAALGSVPRSIKDPLTTFDVNISGFANMMIAARDAGAKRFVYASSSSVYGSDDSPVKREDKTGMPLSPYALSKQTDEQIARNFADLYGMETIGLRYFNVFGRRQDPDGDYAAVIPKFTMSLMKHEAPVINGDGSFSRDFTYVDNAVESNLLALEAGPEAVNRCYNVACGVRTTLNELFALLREILSELDPSIAAIEAVHGKPRKGDIPHSLADISLASKYLGYRPKWQIREGLREAVKWYYSNLK